VAADAEPGDDDGFFDAVRPLTSAMAALAAAFLSFGIPDAASLAMRELSEEQQLAEAVGEPVNSAHSIAHVTAVAASDHLRSFAVLFDASSAPLYAHLVLARACLDACGIAYWIGDPGITWIERAKRYMVMRCANAREIIRSGNPDWKAQAKAIRDSVTAEAAAAGWHCEPHFNSTRHSPSVGGVVFPTPRNRIESMFGGDAESPGIEGMAQVLWWYLSGVTHSSVTAVMQAVTGTESDASPLNPGMRTLGTSALSVVQTAWFVTSAYRRTIDAQRELFGWSSTEWDDAVATFHGALAG
jgi:hypothetical protein